MRINGLTFDGERGHREGPARGLSMLARSLLVTAGIVMGADAFLLLQEPHNPIFSVPSSGLIQWIMLGLLGVIVFMLREYFAKLEKFQAQVDQRLRDLETVTIRHSERLAMFPFSLKQAMNMQKMKELQPEIKRIQEKYKKNLEALSWTSAGNVTAPAATASFTETTTSSVPHRFYRVVAP